MSESRTSRFLRFLSRIRSAQPLAEEDAESVSHLAVNDNEERVPKVIHYDNQREEREKFLNRGFRTYRSAESGLAALGWKEIPVDDRPQIRAGAVANISLAYKLSDRGLPLESRHLAAAKIQGLRIYYRVWAEVEILKGLVHENIVGFYGMFAVDPLLDKDHTDHYKKTFPDSRLFWILLEYANAGDLAKETKRYNNNSIPETGARYYMLQICRGVSHLHDNRIVHNDLHGGNVLLRYKPDGTKVCLICDFGLSEILKPDDQLLFTFRSDVMAVRRIAKFIMLNISRSEEANQMISGHREGHDIPTTITELLDFPWFAGPVCAPIPKEPTPLLQPEVVKRIGYLPPLDPAGTTSAQAFDGPSDAGAETRSDSRGGTFAQRMRERLRSIPHHVRTRIRSLPCVGGRAARRGSESEVELEELPSRRRHEH